MRRSGGGTRCPPAHALDEQGARDVPAPARGEHRRDEQRLHEQRAHAVRVQVVEHLREREAVLWPERDHDRVLAGRGLQLEAEAAAEALAQRQSRRRG
jgi:hypothetical protein